MNAPTARISVCLVSHDTVPFYFAFDLAQLSAFTVASLPDDVEFGLNAISGTYVQCARDDLLKAVVAQEANYILWIDTDMRFPKDALVRLLQRDLPVVGINYAKRGTPTDYVAIKRVGAPGEKLETTEESTGVEEVEAMGFGMVLMKTSALTGLSPMEPWFNVEWREELGQWIGEDVYFFEKLRATGIPIHVDHDLSKECAHIGQFEYKTDHVAAQNTVEV